MKKMFLILLFSFISIFSQTQTATIDLSKLDPTLRAQIEAAQKEQSIEEKINRYGRWVGMGKEVGDAIDGALGAISNRANEFANTKVGMFTMGIIAFKVVGYPIIQLCVGIPLILLGTIFFIWILKAQCLPRKVVTITGEGKEKKREEKFIEPEEQWYSFLAAVIYVIYLALCMAVIFAH